MRFVIESRLSRESLDLCAPAYFDPPQAGLPMITRTARCLRQLP
jgi:hypothetical protein